jgi:hypothetical protein
MSLFTRAGRPLAQFGVQQHFVLASISTALATHLRQNTHASVETARLRTPFSSGVRTPTSQPRSLPRAPTGILQGLFQAIRSASFICTHPASLELRILDLLEALHAPLHLLRSRIISALRVLVDVQLVVLPLALVLALHHVFSQDLCDGLNVLDGVVGFLCAGLEIPGEVIGVAREFSGSSESCLVACVEC